jgi:hypothetical protein
MLDPGAFKIDQTRRPGHAHNIKMLSGELIETQALTVRCPTCGAAPKIRCELAIGGVRPQAHLERRLTVSDKVVRKLRPVRP